MSSNQVVPTVKGVHKSVTVDSHPRLWLVVGDKLGDNSQVEAIAEALDWPFERKQLYFRERFESGKPRFGPSLYHVDRELSDKLEPPWPDLVITVGSRPAMAALWVRKQSGGVTKIVLINRPKKRYLDKFALVIVPAQYFLPDASNVLHLDLPLMRVDQDALDVAAEQWRDTFSDLPRPLTAVLVGGPTQPFVFDATVVERLIAEIAAMIAESGGTVYVTTSRRTPGAVVDAIEAKLPSGSRLYRWRTGGADNPYRGLLTLADRFVVTGDSISMMVEVVRVGKPLAILPLPVKEHFGSRLRRHLARRLYSPAGTNPKGRVWRRLGDLLYRLGVARYSRDLTAFHQLLFDKGLAVSLGKPFLPSTREACDELPRVVERIEALMNDRA